MPHIYSVLRNPDKVNIVVVVVVVVVANDGHPYCCVASYHLWFMYVGCVCYCNGANDCRQVCVDGYRK